MSTPPTRRPGRLRRRWHDIVAMPRPESGEAFWTALWAEAPGFTEAVVADARITARKRGERWQYRSRADAAVQVLRLCLVTESFFAQVCYRAEVRCRARKIPIVPWLLDRIALRSGQLSIGDSVLIEAGVCIPHGWVCIGGLTTIRAGSTVTPFTSVGLVEGDYVGPTIGRNVLVGTGSRVLGPVTVGDNAVIGANALVVRDVPAGAVVGGVPARVLTRSDDPGDAPG